MYHYEIGQTNFQFNINVIVGECNPNPTIPPAHAFSAPDTMFRCYPSSLKLHDTPPPNKKHTHTCPQLESRVEWREAVLQIWFPQSEPLIITPQYQLQQPCTDAKPLWGLATLPYLIWRGSIDTLLYHQPIKSAARVEAYPGSASNHSAQINIPSKTNSCDPAA